MLAQKAKAAGFTWLALELDDFGNSLRWGAFSDACHLEGILAGSWVTQGGNAGMLRGDFGIVEIEGPADYMGLVSAIPNMPDIRRAIVTNFGGIDTPELAEPIIDAGFDCLTEAYLGDNPLATPERLDWRARQLGWASSQPVFGVWNKPLVEYDEWMGLPAWSVYVAENVL